jgi:hypothetical protein
MVVVVLVYQIIQMAVSVTCSHHPHLRIAVRDGDCSTNKKSDVRMLQWGVSVGRVGVVFTTTFITTTTEATTIITATTITIITWRVAKWNLSECGVKVHHCHHQHSHSSSPIHSSHSHPISVVCSRRRSPRIDETDVDCGTKMNSSSHKGCHCSSNSNKRLDPQHPPLVRLATCQSCVSPRNQCPKFPVSTLVQHQQLLLQHHHPKRHPSCPAWIPSTRPTVATATRLP